MSTHIVSERVREGYIVWEGDVWGYTLWEGACGDTVGGGLWRQCVGVGLWGHTVWEGACGGTVLRGELFWGQWKEHVWGHTVWKGTCVETHCVEGDVWGHYVGMHCVGKGPNLVRLCQSGSQVETVSEWVSRGDTD